MTLGISVHKTWRISTFEKFLTNKTTEKINDNTTTRGHKTDLIIVGVCASIYTSVAPTKILINIEHNKGLPSRTEELIQRYCCHARLNTSRALF